MNKQLFGVAASAILFATNDKVELTVINANITEQNFSHGWKTTSNVAKHGTSEGMRVIFPTISKGEIKRSFITLNYLSWPYTLQQ